MASVRAERSNYICGDRGIGRPAISTKRRLLSVGGIVAIVAMLWWALPLSTAESPSSSNSRKPDLLSLLANLSDEGFQRPSSEWKLNLPEDHGAHARSRTEIWQVVAHLEKEGGDTIGFQFSFMRVGVLPPSASQEGSAWDIRDVNRGHVTFLDARLAEASAEERFQRHIPKLSGYDTDAEEVRLDNWFLRFGYDNDGTKMTLYATVSDKAVLELVMRPEKPAYPLEPDGTEAPFVGYSLTRLAVEGTVDQGQGKHTVMGTAWLDHLWGELPVPGTGPVTRDRLLLQLEDGTDISVIRSRRADGRGAPTINGIIVDPSGAISPLDDEEFQMTSSGTWRHPSTGKEFPVQWRVSGPGLDISIEPLSEAQAQDFVAPIWSGIVEAAGTRDDKAVSGFGTLQLTE